MDIIDALYSRTVFGPLFKKRETWAAWEVYLRALFGLGITDAAQLDLFKACTGLDAAPSVQNQESFVICGRRSGKSFMSAVIAAYLASFKDWRPYLSPGERGWIFVVATDKSQAGIIKNYISGIFDRTACLKKLVTRETQESIDLRNGISIAVKPCSFRAIRGYTLIAAILEEMAFYRSDEFANPDRAVLAAIRPALATIPESLLIGISTPYARSGVLWEMFKNYYGQPGGPLVWRAATRTMNPTINQGLIAKALAEDPQAARAEYEADWREDIAAFMPSEVVEAVVVPGRFELPKVAELQYKAFIDPSGGRADSFTLAIAHKDSSGKAVLDVLRERRPPFQPQGVVGEFSEVLKAYGLFSAQADAYAAEWVRESFRAHEVSLEPSKMSASELYQNFLPLVLNGSAELLDSRRLVAQLAGLERRTRAGGKDLVTHYAGGHDDLANAAAGACVAVAGRGCDFGYDAGDSACVDAEGDDDDDDDGPSIGEFRRVFRC